jgi:hypothetical protein
MFELSSIKKVSRKQHKSHNFVQVC